jgi:endonuclease/exonuclease/phosphatase (EEP) superfamily protein YafD
MMAERLMDVPQLPFFDNDVVLKEEEQIKLHYFLNCFSFYFTNDNHKLDIDRTCKIIHLSLCFCIDSDIFDVHKGSMLYAAPQNLQIDHFVIIISTIKGKAICDTRNINTYIVILISHFNLEVLPTKNKLINKPRQSDPNKIHPLERWHIAQYKFEVHKVLKVLKRHLTNIISNKLKTDIETNQGPGLPKNTVLKIITVNCRGLGNIDKCRLLLNKINRITANDPAVVMLQETMILTDNYLKLAWRGKYIHTPGTGNSQGCITLLPSTATIIVTDHFGTRGHYAKIQNILANDEEAVAICNIYAPNGFGQEKIQFMNSIFDKISTFNGATILGGDINTTLSDLDRYKRGVTVVELRVADLILNKVDELNLNDSWMNSIGYTWRRGQVMSKLDRVFYRINDYRLKNSVTDWTVTSSDHAAVIVTLEHLAITRRKNEHIKLDNDIIKNPVFLNEIREYLQEQLATATNMNPHMKLEFAKMSVRTITLSSMKRERSRETTELNEINNDITVNMGLLTRVHSPEDSRLLTIELETLNTRKEQILQAQGTKLAQYAKSRWYNEGEKSNKYFLNLLKRRTQNNDMSRLMIDGSIVTDEAQIRTEVTRFYSELYNSTNMVENPDHLLRNMFTVAPNDSNYISQPLTLEELWLNLKNTKATTPGPDGMSNIYLKKLWHIMGPLILNAWLYSIEIGEMPPSHKNSILRLIPKQGKDLTNIKNWRPITLSNCDHKLITRTYNSRLLKIINAHITTTQTAYIKGRNISDNLRLINSAVKLADHERDVDGVLIALDAQKAFDSVNHDYIVSVLQRCSLSNFIPLFKLLYSDLHNDIMINGKLGSGYNICNGVKQGDALSCSLFILAIEPVIRNINNNDNIDTISSRAINYTWPKILGYADDLTILTKNNNQCIEEVFAEYEFFTRASGLKLNADKTEIFTIRNSDRMPDAAPVNINY